ncbi:hypothetical protein HNP25_003298 [Arcicella rosea]|uniref:Uncharacterized protein n=1 Tax=Arcicella rosea TaxID=502909 RepID=A0A841ELV2_9BACT|nr:hypothetical protein [Arcicella rosea]
MVAFGYEGYFFDYTAFLYLMLRRVVRFLILTLKRPKFANKI